MHHALRGMDAPVIYIFFIFELILPSKGANNTDPSFPLVSIAIIAFIFLIAYV